MEQALNMVKELVATGVDSTVACIQAANQYGLSVQSVINQWMWA